MSGLNGYQKSQRERRKRERLMKARNDKVVIRMARKRKRIEKARVLPLPKAWQPETLAPDVARLRARVEKNQNERKRRPLRPREMDLLAQGLIATANQNNEGMDSILRILSSVATLESWLIARLVYGLMTAGAGGKPIGGARAERFVKELARLGKVDSNPDSY
jgi:hypothetical protein